MDNNMIEEYKKTKCSKLRDNLVLYTIPAITYIAKSLRGSSLVTQDLIQEGVIAVIRACDTFDINKQTSFKTYSTNCARFAMLSYLRTDNTIPRCSNASQTRELCFSTIPLRHSEIVALAASKGVSYKKVLNYALLSTPSLSSIDFIASDDDPSVQAEKLEEYEILRKKLDKLKPRHYDIINARAVNQETLIKIASDQGVSHQRIQQIITYVSEKLGVLL